MYGFGVVLLELLSGQRALDPNRPAGQQNLVDYAKPSLSDRRKLARLMDPRLEGQYPSKAAFQVAQLTLRCLAGEPKNRPPMKEVADTLEQIEALKGRSKGTHGTPPPQQMHHRSPVHHRSPLHPNHNVVGQAVRSSHHAPRLR